VLVAFVRNEYPIAKDRLERAYQQSFGAVLKWIEKRSDPATSVIDTATTVGAKVARPFCKDRKFRLLREQARNVGLVDQLVPMHRALQDFDTDLILLMTVGNADAKITAEAAVTFEDLVAAEARSDSHSTVQEATADAESFDQLSLMRLVRLVRSSSMQELERARDSANIFHEFAKALGPLAKRQFGAVRAFAWLTLGSANDRTVAFLIPGFVWIRHRHGKKIDATIAFMAEWTPYFTAANIVLDELPSELHVIAEPNGYESLTPAQQRRVATHLAHLETAHPRELELARNPPAVPELLR